MPRTQAIFIRDSSRAAPRTSAQRGVLAAVLLSACTQGPPAPAADAAPPGPPARAESQPNEPSDSTTKAAPDGAVAVPGTTAAAAVALPSASVVTSASGAPPVVDPTPPPIACQSDDDCWLERGPDDRDHAVSRPKRLRGKKLRPCKDAGHTPACHEGICVVRHWKC